MRNDKFPLRRVHLFLFFFLCISFNFYGQVKVDPVNNVGVGTEIVDPAAKLEIHSVNQGFLKPRLTWNEVNNIPTPIPPGLEVYVIDEKKTYWYDGLNWVTYTTGVNIGSTDLSVSGTNSPLTIESSSGNDITITAGSGISLTGTSSDITINNSFTEVDGDVTNELQTLSSNGTAGNISLSQNGGTVNINVNDPDNDPTNELQHFNSSSDIQVNGAGTNGDPYNFSLTNNAVGNYGWLLNGNSNVSSTHKLGSKNAVDLSIITGDKERISISATSGRIVPSFLEDVSNIIIGNNAGNDLMTGGNNIFFGINSGSTNTEGAQNVFFGHNSGVNNDEGICNIFIGDQAGHSNTSGNYNNFIGDQTGYSNVDGENNNLFWIFRQVTTI